MEGIYVHIQEHAFMFFRKVLDRNDTEDASCFDRLYRIWVDVVFLWSIYSAFFTPLEFGFFRGLPELLKDLDCVQVIFLSDVVLQFFVAYRDAHTHKMVCDRRRIALRYLKGSFAKVPLFQGCSDEFLNQIVMRLNEEFFLPGDVVIEQGSPADQVYIILLGYLVSAELLMM
ncbi:hypothetical protein B296_00006401 [Ensete ventricosum]|uniref:Cyclic nucleotide-binding domain-containing protein n=1 Tax=Ensete ventricosum TaxID=4639 RepID=A0A427ANY6_ENSVE|nr:hypothetical protein B296_00006401 [Ensete ventricosum]